MGSYIPGFHCDSNLENGRVGPLLSKVYSISASTVDHNLYIYETQLFMSFPLTHQDAPNHNYTKLQTTDVVAQWWCSVPSAWKVAGSNPTLAAKDLGHVLHS